MILTDFHMHSKHSSDAKDTMLDMALATGEAGVKIMCFTDHCDIDAYTTGVFDPRCFGVWPPMLQEYRALLSVCPPGLDIRLGLELGEANHSPELANDIASQKELDFILGSIHNLRDTPDFFALKYKSEEHCIYLLREYLDELYELAGMDCFDCISHIGYTRRYMLRAGFTAAVEDERYAQQVDALLRRIVERGKGIELNCSGLRRRGIESPIPGVSILRRYLELGGEIITVGSDSHRVSDAGSGVKQGMEILRELGYRYYSVYKNRKPEFLKID